ncbi:hypothetical protein EON80_20480 [bacterium]|nr:MAG: hypothetical protein EON80_20480 [bacterium]
MKRIPLREFLFVAAPVAILGAGLYGAKLREHHWPTRPRIDACRVRPATPLEVYGGKQIAVSVEAVAPLSFLKGGGPEIRCSLVGRPQPKTKTPPILHLERRGNYNYTEQQYAYTWKEFSTLPSPRIAEVVLLAGDSHTPLVKGQFELSTDGVVLPDPTAARTANFRLTKAQLRCTNASIKSELLFEAEDVRDETQGRLTSLEFLKMAMSHNNQSSPIYWLSSSFGPTSSDPRSMNMGVEVDLSSWEVPSSTPTTVRCLLSIMGGWPQEIEVELPKRLDHYVTDLKFTSKLAPLPVSSQ